MSPALASLTECIQPQLADVERMFHEELNGDLKCVNVLVRHVSRFRGKMLRPCLGAAQRPGVLARRAVDRCSHGDRHGG